MQRSNGVGALFPLMSYPSRRTLALSLLPIVLSAFFMLGRKNWDPKDWVSVHCSRKAAVLPAVFFSIAM